MIFINYHMELSFKIFRETTPAPTKKKHTPEIANTCILIYDFNNLFINHT